MSNTIGTLFDSQAAKGKPVSGDGFTSAILQSKVDALYETDFQPLRVTENSGTRATVNVAQDFGKVYFFNTPLAYAGGVSPSITAGTNYRLNGLSINPSGTLTWTPGADMGTAGTNPDNATRPITPKGEIPLCEVWQIGTNTSIYNVATGTNCYIYRRCHSLYVNPVTNIRCRAKRTTTQALTAGTAAKVQLNAEDYDSGTNFDSTTNYRFTVPTGGGGGYLIETGVEFSTLSDTTYRRINLKKNASEFNPTIGCSGVGAGTSVATNLTFSTEVELVDADYVELFAISSVNLNINTAWMSIRKTW